jgi:alkanesulfonate monooxygenase SsuD/methylene tetrahydromethanopterin reductase-like flavin-dependent oxidoreductase (luciferase family)
MLSRQEVSRLLATTEAIGFDSVWTAEAWGSDAMTPLVWIAAQTSKTLLFAPSPRRP